MNNKERTFFNRYESSDTWSIDISKYSTKEDIEQHLETIIFQSKSDRESYATVLRFLYDKDYNIPLSRNTVKRQIERGRLTMAERLAANKLSYRSSGSKSKNQYGMPAVQAMRNANYRCEVCGLSDLRCLDIDHIKGRKKKLEETTNPYTVNDFQILCANHHGIKTRMELLSEDTKEKGLLQLLQSYDKTSRDPQVLKNRELIIQLKSECDNHSYESSIMTQVNSLFKEKLD